ncbi:MAG: hypothetical protein WC262_10970 [Bacteroidales bacterium]|jgi:hypothetical protein
MERSLRIRVGLGEYLTLEIKDLLHDIFLALSDEEFASIAAANGYVKLEPGQVVVQRVDAEHAATFMLGTKAHIGIIADGVLIQPCDIRRNFIAALDASGGK